MVEPSGTCKGYGYGTRQRERKRIKEKQKKKKGKGKVVAAKPQVEVRESFEVFDGCYTPTQSRIDAALFTPSPGSSSSPLCFSPLLSVSP